MNIKRIFVILGKDLLHGPRGFFVVLVVAAPLLITLVVNLVAGDLFAGTPKLAVTGDVSSAMVALLQQAPQVKVVEYTSKGGLKSAVERGAADMGLVIPQGLDGDIASGRVTSIQAYVWGESSAKDRLVMTTAVSQAARQLGAQQDPINVQTVVLGSGQSQPWRERLMPLTVMMAIFFAGLMLPAVSLIEEKQKRTLNAIAVTPASLSDIFIAKAILGVVLSMIMGVVILLINSAWGDSPMFLLGTLFLAAIMASEIGLILGTLITDMNTLFAVWKFGGLVLFGPAIVYMFPQLPQWLGYLFPTYYLVRPIMDVSLGTANSMTLVISLIGLMLVAALALLESRLVSQISGKGPSHRLQPAEA